MFADISEFLTHQLEDENIISSDKRELYKYGFQNGMILILNFITSLIIGALFGMFLEIILLLAAYIPFRSYAGGHHASSAEKCYIVSSAIEAIWVCMLKFEIIPARLLIAMLIIGVCVCLLLAPVESKNKSLDEQERRIYKKMALIILSAEVCIWFILTFVLHIFEEIIPLAIFTEAVMLVLGKIALNKAK